MWPDTHGLHLLSIADSRWGLSVRLWDIRPCGWRKPISSLSAMSWSIRQTGNW